LKGAKQHFTETIRLNPLHADAYNNIGAILAWQGKKCTAKQFIEQAMKLNPDSSEIYNNYNRISE